MEGRDVYTGSVDVIVCDGFVGNVALKVSEGLVDVIRQMLKQSMKATVTRKVGAFLAQGAFAEFKKRVDYSEYGGAPLLGLNGICMVCHGRSNAKAIRNAIQAHHWDVRVQNARDLALRRRRGRDHQQNSFHALRVQ